MKLHDLRCPAGSRKAKRRVGRGIGSGLGKTSGKGHKGQKARSGGVKGPEFEGGQMPLVRRVPKRGFTNVFREEPAVVNVASLNRFEDGQVVTPEELADAGLVSKRSAEVKVLGEGNIGRKLTVRAHGFSKSAAEKIEAAGGKAEVI